MAAVAAALFIRLLLDPVLGESLPFYVFYFAVIVASLRGGIGPGLTALVAGFIAASYFFAYPRFSFAVADSRELMNGFRFLSLGLAVVIAGGWVYARRSRQRLHIEEERRQKQRILREAQTMHSTLASIGDGLITVNNDARITFMNEAAERLSGWSSREAEGQLARDVFQIVRGPRREPIVDPLWLCMREKKNVVVPDGSILRSRTGEEHTIGDSAAPIRDHQGNIIGAVLVFHEVFAPITTDEPGTGPFEIASIEYYPSDHIQPRLGAEELQRLNVQCRDWIHQEWRPADNAIRMIALDGLDLVIKQRLSETRADGKPALHFQVNYDRAGEAF
jgi:PAS domain S-box-containing protein